MGIICIIIDINNEIYKSTSSNKRKPEEVSMEDSALDTAVDSLKGSGPEEEHSFGRYVPQNCML